MSRLFGMYAAGRILNPRTARSQFLGGMIMGMGMALHEEGVLDRAMGEWVNHDLAEYHIPAHADVEWIDAAWLDERAGPRYAELVGYHLEQAHRWHAELRPRAVAERLRLAEQAAERLGAAAGAALQRGDLPGGVNLLRRTAELLPADAPARWSVGFWVSDADGVAARAGELGGAVLAPPSDTPMSRTAPGGVCSSSSRHAIR